MDVIPVIDVRHGVAVAAARGDRANYMPIRTPLCEGSAPASVVEGYARLFAFPILYVADLDGIEGRGRNVGLAQELAPVISGATLWIDDGGRPREAAARIAAGQASIPVIGTESLAGEADVEVLRSLPAESYVLSLDFKGEDFMGPRDVLDEPDHWPERIIVMTLKRIGSGEGPDIKRVADIVARANGKRVYAAGGVRDRADIEALHEVGAAGVLVATALHSGQIKTGDLREIAGF
jgi:phosphoribosylformimino-5-aminoimidazole carboxamide ribotide isomerase